MCCSFFGEVVLPSSRVFFDDSDDEEDTSSAGGRVSLELKELVEGSLAAPSDLLIICEGNVARGFVQHHVNGNRTQKLAEITLPADPIRRPDDFTLPRASEPTVLYKLNDATRVLDVSPAIDMLLANNLTVLIEPSLKAARKIVVLCNRPAGDFRCDSHNDLPSAFLRSLKSSSWTEPVDQRTVEQPNFISGLPASIVSWCEASDKPCLVTICFTDTDRADSITVDPLVKFFQSTDLAPLLLPTQGRPITYKMKSVSDCNMYM